MDVSGKIGKEKITARRSTSAGQGKQCATAALPLMPPPNTSASPPVLRFSWDIQNTQQRHETRLDNITASAPGLEAWQGMCPIKGGNEMRSRGIKDKHDKERCTAERSCQSLKITG